MKTKVILGVLLFVVLCLGTSCASQSEKIEVYSFSGGNDFMEINNGVIIIADELEKFVGGDLSFKGEELSSVKSSVTRFYFYKEGVEATILDNTVILEGVSEGGHVSSDTGSISSKPLFTSEDWDLIKNALHFSLSGTFMNGETFTHSMILELREVY